MRHQLLRTALITMAALVALPTPAHADKRGDQAEEADTKPPPSANVTTTTKAKTDTPPVNTAPAPDRQPGTKPAGSSSTASPTPPSSGTTGGSTTPTTTAPVTPPTPVAPPATGTTPTWTERLQAHLDSLTVHRLCYVRELFDCDDFSRFLIHDLRALGYDAQLVLISAPTTPTPWERWGVHTPFVHAFVLVRSPDGGAVFVEPQEARILDLDLNGDGVTTMATQPGTAPTEGQARLEVYPTTAAATAAGVTLDAPIVGDPRGFVDRFKQELADQGDYYFGWLIRRVIR